MIAGQVSNTVTWRVHAGGTPDLDPFRLPIKPVPPGDQHDAGDGDEREQGFVGAFADLLDQGLAPRAQGDEDMRPDEESETQDQNEKTHRTLPRQSFCALRRAE